jgi:hypothetical protein
MSRAVMQHTGEGAESAQRYWSCFLVEDTHFHLSVTIHTHILLSARCCKLSWLCIGLPRSLRYRLQPSWQLTGMEICYINFPNASLRYFTRSWPYCPFIPDTNTLQQIESHYRQEAPSQKLTPFQFVKYSTYREILQMKVTNLIHILLALPVLPNNEPSHKIDTIRLPLHVNINTNQN